MNEAEPIVTSADETSVQTFLSARHSGRKQFPPPKKNTLRYSPQAEMAQKAQPAESDSRLGRARCRGCLPQQFKELLSSPGIGDILL